ncbi:tumor necrosis factor ligand superfamily member 9 [Microcebus murinus]|uniref:tumor necrosis factor ligand superfamily member 9 n=1 Tax=Microcebus murinus TaxID=30608 RepID=UPI0006438FD4
MHSSPDAARDPEAPWQPAPCARSALRWVLGVVALLLVTGAAAVGVRYWELWRAPALASPAPTPIQRGGPELSPDDPQQQGFPVFGQLVAEDVLLTDGPLGWYSDAGLDGVLLSPGVSYDKDTRQLQVTEAGVYYVFLQAELRHVAVLPSAGGGSVSFALRTAAPAAAAAPAGPAALTLTVHLPPGSSEAPHSVSGFRSRLLHLGAGQRLGVHLSAGPEAPQHWQLDQRATVVGLFRVASDVPAGLRSPRPT